MERDMNGIFSWIAFGLFCGVLAKLILPGNDGMGWIRTILLGIAGSFVGGFLGSFFGMGSPAAWSRSGVVTAVAGALVLLIINRIVTRS
jgi:uncharacterized membrane protein YeaQ/YmgE (transglycosylase-associated protein family)